MKARLIKKKREPEFSDAPSTTDAKGVHGLELIVAQWVKEKAAAQGVKSRAAFDALFSSGASPQSPNEDPE
ncbi:MAG: hypothetical protein KBD66_02790 [Candidatus Doudnabacteria bacterium]|nr:hypothetical protein [Candidatus Doudnabacteria bacterium]